MVDYIGPLPFIKVSLEDGGLKPCLSRTPRTLCVTPSLLDGSIVGLGLAPLLLRWSNAFVTVACRKSKIKIESLIAPPFPDHNTSDIPAVLADVFWKGTSKNLARMWLHLLHIEDCDEISTAWSADKESKISPLFLHPLPLGLREISLKKLKNSVIHNSTPYNFIAQCSYIVVQCFCAWEGQLMYINFDWDDRKEADNIENHGVDFSEAREVFYDPLSQEFIDEESVEERWILIGTSKRGRLLLIIFQHVDDSTARIISARSATTHERQDYEEGI